MKIVLPGHAQPPQTQDLALVRRAAKKCAACPLYKLGTQTVFGEGPENAPVVLVGEQPGDKEDVAGRPFVGPAGRLLDKALAEAGLPREAVYVTNAVKHFKWEPRGKQRIHKKPSSREIAACRPWLEKELELIHPQIVVCLGGTAAKNLLGPQVRVLKDRGRIFTSEFCPRTLVTVHPSSLLRAPDDAGRKKNYRLFVRDLQRAARELGQLSFA
jgi:uracil-DNA glycosylase family protein